MTSGSEMKVIPPGLRNGLPIKVWASQVEDSCIDQAVNLANLPFAIGHIALMPDAHPGYGMPIGGVLFADDAIVPYAVGVDIGCGVSLQSTGMVDLEGKLQTVLDRIAARVPVGNGPGAQHEIGLEPALNWKTILAEVPDISRFSSTALDAVSKAETQLGTLGGGNHFIEIQRDEYGEIFVMLHSGSRSVGKKICDHWHKIALDLNQRWHSVLPDKELAYLPWGSEEARGYFHDMRLAMLWAEQNRGRMRDAVSSVFIEEFGVEPTLITDIHHNYAAWENHRGRNGIVHRKGAVRSREGEVVLIPGSMGTASYVGEGLGNPESFMSCQHGAGRARSRSATTKLESEEHFKESMSGILMGGKAAAARDESPFAYKDIETVMADSADLVRPVQRLTPMGVVKG